MGNRKRFKRIYVEITNACNLHCSFCQENLRPARFMSVGEFQRVCAAVSPFTDYIYLHVKGEPLLHPDLEKILQIADCAGLKVNITTNGTLAQKRLNILLRHPPHQINVSFHSASDNTGVDFEDYVKSLFHALLVLHAQTPCELSLRLWTVRERPEIFGVSNLDILQRLHINLAAPFDWPDPAGAYCKEDGICQGLRTHIGILCDGTVVPCCLDGNGNISLGNIFTQSLEEILSAPRAQRMLTEFTQHRKACEELCRHCSFKEKFS